MQRTNEPQGFLARLSNPLLALLIAAVAAVGAIAQCGLLLDAAVVAGVPASGPVESRAVSAERPRLAAAAPSAEPVARSPQRN